VIALANLVQHLGFAVLLALVSACVVRLMIAVRVLDHPNERSAHSRATPRGGGLGVVVAFVLGMVVLYQVGRIARVADMEFLGVIGAALAIAGVAMVDDVRSLSARFRLLAQGAAALVAVASGLVIERLAIPWVGVVELGWLGAVLTLVWIVGCTNAVNFMDGLDGLVGGTLLIVCAALAAIAVDQGGWFVYAAALFLAAGFAGFLPFNWHPAKIFMGDVGSQFAGFMLAVLAVGAAGFDGQQLSFLLVPLLMFGLLFDAAFTLGRRAMQGAKLSEGHRTHLYQLAQRSGIGVRAVALLHYAFALFHAALAVLFLQLPSPSKPFVVLPALAVQLAWMLYVMRRMRGAGVGWR
jgi:UDP-GlcNAc:undecaprenyl-phosphate/decaprenyl-phosphate GlcNAc-1-phosphate transferase